MVMVRIYREATVAIQDIIPKSRGTIRYRTNITGVPQDIELPFRVLLIGDFSGKNGGEKDKYGVKCDLENRPIHNLNGDNTDAVMKRLNIKAGNYSITSMHELSPENATDGNEEIFNLMQQRRVLSSIVSDLSNSKLFREQMIDLINLSDSDMENDVKAQGVYDFLKIEDTIVQDTEEAASPAQKDEEKTDDEKPNEKGGK